MVIFHSYVKLPEGRHTGWLKNYGMSMDAEKKFTGHFINHGKLVLHKGNKRRVALLTGTSLTRFASLISWKNMEKTREPI